MKSAIKLYIIIVLITAKMTTNEKGIHATQEMNVWDSYHIKKKKKDIDDCFLVQRVWKSLGEWQMHMLFLHHASLWTVFWGQLGPEEVRENWLTAVLHTGIFLPLAQHQNATDGESRQSVMSLGCWSLGEAQKGNSRRLLEPGFGKTLGRIWPWKGPESTWNVV